MKKEFKKAAASVRPVYHTIIGNSKNTQEVQEVQEVQDAQEVQHVQEVEAGREDALGAGTQGRKGRKLPRINMAFSPENLDYLRVMAALGGQSMTQYVNALIEADRGRRAGVYESARALGRKGGDGHEEA